MPAEFAGRGRGGGGGRGRRRGGGRGEGEEGAGELEGVLVLAYTCMSARAASAATHLASEQRARVHDVQEVPQATRVCGLRRETVLHTPSFPVAYIANLVKPRLPQLERRIVVA